MKDIMKIILELMKEMDHPDIVSCLEFLITRYQSEIGPFAYDLVDQLVMKFFFFNLNLKKR